MLKRKRSSAGGADSRPSELSRETKRQRRHLGEVIEASTKQLSHAFKFARSFERQKLGRRQKSAEKKSKDQDKERIVAEIDALKDIELAQLAELYLCRQLARITAVAEHEALPSFVKHKAKKEQPKTAAYVNVTSRLYKSDPVTKCLERVMKDVRGVLGLKSSEAKVKKKRLRKADYEAMENGGEKADGGEKTLDTGDPRTVPADNTSLYSDEGGMHKEFRSESDSNEPFADVHDDGRDQEAASKVDTYPSFDREANGTSRDPGESDAEEMDYSQYDARLASSSDDDEDDEEFPTVGQTFTNHDRVSTFEGGEIDMASVSGSIASSRSPSLPRRVPAAKDVNTTQSAFLPSLNTGYISGSDSDFSEASVLAPPRKNRMGQRARQAMWERKYGSKAKHIEKGGPSMLDRDKGWDLKRGAQEEGRGGGRRGRGFRVGRGGRNAGSGSNSIPVAGRGLSTDGPAQPEKTPTYGKVHPSWAAKEAASKKASMAGKPAGQKITFD